MFTQPTQIPRSPLASTLTVVVHLCVALLVIGIATAIPHVPRAVHRETLTFVAAAPIPDFKFEMPAPKPLPTPRFEEPVLPKPEPKPFLETRAPAPEPKPEPKPEPIERPVVEPPKPLPPPPKPAVVVGAFADATQVTKPERTLDVVAAGFESEAARAARTRLEVRPVDGFATNLPATAKSPTALVADAGFGTATADASRRPQGPRTTAAAGFSAEEAPRTRAQAPRTTARAGFSADPAPRPAPAPKPEAPVRAGFAETPPAPRPPVQAPPPPRADRPVEVLYKPTPEYTEEARARRIEGEVALEVEFTASGQVRVIRVVRGLGYGLDEMARRAAEQIRFRPATSNGTPVDFRAHLTIVFRLT